MINKYARGGEGEAGTAYASDVGMVNEGLSKAMDKVYVKIV